jgi:hypothetical protein
MVRSGRTGMTEGTVLSHFDHFISDDSVRTALVIEDMENLSLLGEVKSQFVARLGEWSALKTRNENVMIFITNRDPLDENSERAMRDVGAEFAEISNLVNVALGKKGEANGFILYIPPPYEEEVERLLNEFRLKKRWEIKWGEYRNIVRWIAATNKRLKTLDGKFRAPLANNELSLASAKQNELIDGDPDPRSALDRLSEMIGRDEVKKQVARFVSLLKKRDGDSSQTTEFPNLHLAFTGNPGTGKTIVARLIGEIYRELGLLRRGHVVECRSDDLVAEHLGGTGPKTNAKINEALDGVLFVDEAYLLDKDEHGDFGKKAIGTIMARMENERHRISVVMAGYQRWNRSSRRMLDYQAGLAGIEYSILPTTHQKSSSTSSSCLFGSTAGTSMRTLRLPWLDSLSLCMRCAKNPNISRRPKTENRPMPMRGLCES